MIEKKVCFIHLKVKEKNTKRYLNNREFKTLIENIFNQYGHDKDDGSGREVLDLTPTIVPQEVEDKVVLEKKVLDKDMFFGALGKQKTNNTIQKRNYKDYKTEDVLTPSEVKNIGLETYTYFTFDFETGILSEVYSRGVKCSKLLNLIFDEYDPNYVFEFVDIPNIDGLGLLYNSKKPEIVMIEMEQSNFNLRLMEELFNTKEDDLLESLKGNTRSLSVCIKPERCKGIETDVKFVRKIIDILKKKKGDCKKLRFSGKSESIPLATFDMFEQYYTYPINAIDLYDVINGEKKQKTYLEVSNTYCNKIRDAYNKNKGALKAIIEES